ncbi:MAG: OmpA family protein [Polyangiaceae bacterium]|nr:OmpA family protein [Polyangiaceae bacterium]
MKHRARLWLGLGIVGTTLGLAGCGYSEQEWQAQLDKYQRLLALNHATEQKLAESDRALDAARQKVAKLEGDLSAAGVDITKLNRDLESRSTEISQLSSTLEEREKALREYQERAKLLEAIKQRFERLRAKLTELTRLGLNVVIRRNRMIISLPGDVLFPSGQDTLTKDGQAILLKVADVIRNDPQLLQREYQVVGHTDNKPLRGGAFKDNWGLSMMRAREVLLFLVGDKGQMPLERWSAGGLGDIDPIATNDTDEGRQKNRRCELIVMPSAEEMLSLQNIVQ